MEFLFNPFIFCGTSFFLVTTIFQIFFFSEYQIGIWFLCFNMNNSCSKLSTYSPTQTKRQFCPWKFFKTLPNLPFISSRLKSSNKSISPKITFPALKKNKKPCFSPISLTYPHCLPPATAACPTACIAALPLRPPHSGSDYLQVLSLSLSLPIWKLKPKLQRYFWLCQPGFAMCTFFPFLVITYNKQAH